LYATKKRKLKNITLLIQVIVLFFIFGGCAKMGSMSGGYKDVEPPVVLNSKPENFSTNTNSQKIEILFDEYIVLKNVNQELIISPPLPEKPEVRIKNKSITIDLNNELRENTTYTLNFGKAIADNNESNPLTNYEFVFSTGPFLDSLSVNGTLVNSFNLQSSKDPFIIGLYDQFEDSVPIKSIPVYIGKTDEKGHFVINNIKSDTFKVFALKDMNNNLIFDLPTEEIGFADTLLILTPEFLRSIPLRTAEKDTMVKDTLKVKPPFAKKKGKNKEKDNINVPQMKVVNAEDSVSTDSMKQINELPALYVDMVYFLEEGTKQYMTNSDRLGKENFQLCFSLPLKEDPGIKLLNYDVTEDWYLKEINAKRDTFIYWLTDTTLINKDSVILEIVYPMTDSMGEIYTNLDTLKFISRKPEVKTSKNKSAVKTPKVKIIQSTIRNNGVLDLNLNVPFNFIYPLQNVDTSFLHLYIQVDTIEKMEKFEILYDTISFRKINLSSKWKERGKYKIKMLPGAFTDIYNHTNDTMQISFGVQEKSFYGSLIVTMSNVKVPVVLQLMNEKEVVLRSKFASADGVQVFDFLPPAKYKLKYIYDVNGNRKWDTGNYLKKIQPEKVKYHVGEINIRSNWDLEVKEEMLGQ
jgi:hypothetical protein